MLLRFPRSRIPILVPGGHSRDLHLGERSRRTAWGVRAGRDESRVLDSFDDLHGQEGFCGLQCLRSAKGWFLSWLRLWAGDSALGPDQSPPPGPSLSGTAWPPATAATRTLLELWVFRTSRCQRCSPPHLSPPAATSMVCVGVRLGFCQVRGESGSIVDAGVALQRISVQRPPPRAQGLVTNRDCGSLWASVPPGCVHESCKRSCVRRSFRKPAVAFSVAVY